MKVCKKCKTHVANKAKICKKCGADVSKAKIIKTTNNKNTSKSKNTKTQIKQKITPLVEPKSKQKEGNKAMIYSITFPKVFTFFNPRISRITTEPKAPKRKFNNIKPF